MGIDKQDTDFFCQGCQCVRSKKVESALEGYCESCFGYLQKEMEKKEKSPFTEEDIHEIAAALWIPDAVVKESDLVNMDYPLPGTCRQLGEEFPKMVTEMAFLKEPQSENVILEKRENISYWQDQRFFLEFPAPTHHQLWSMLPKVDKNGFKLHITEECVYYINLEQMILNPGNGWDIGLEQPIKDGHTTEALAQMLIRQNNKSK